MSKNDWNCKCEPNTPNTHRYALIYKYKNSESEKTATIVMLNPSKANSSRLDPTMGIVLNKMQRLCYTKVIILNLFSYITSKQEKLQEKINESLEEAIGEENDSYIERYLNNAAIAIIAWGNAEKINKSKLKERIRGILKKINVKIHKMGDWTKHNQPKHGRAWRKDDRPNLLSMVDIDKLLIDIK